MIDNIERFTKKVFGKDIFADEHGSTDMIYMMIIVAVGYAIYTILGPALVAPGITTIQNTAAIANYSTWTTQQQSMWSSSGVFTMLGWMLIPVALVLGMFKSL
jgi:hypothetical protein